MATWSDYKNHDRKNNPGIATDIARVEALAQVFSQEEHPNIETTNALNEYDTMKAHPEKYKRYSSFREVVDDVIKNTKFLQ